MGSLFVRHPHDRLVRYLDSELAPREIRGVDRHLASCPSCRAELEELRSSLAECGQLWKAQAPAATQPWRDLRYEFQSIDQSLAHRSLVVRLMRPLVYSGALRWSFVAGLAVLMVLVSLHQLRQAPSVQAATILRKAVQVADSAPRPGRQVRVRTSRRQDFRLAAAQGALLQLAEAQAVAAMFQSAGFDCNDPLSARAFQNWRDQQIHKTDEVSAVSNPQAPSDPFTQIRTVSQDGAIEAATITFDTSQYPVDERLEFRDREWVELSEIAENSTEDGGASIASHGEPPVRAAEPPSRPAASSPGTSASITDELQVLSALSAIGADLGEHVEVALADGKVLVTGGEGLSSRRQNEIRASVADLPHVEVDFSTAAHAVAPPAAAAASEPAAGAAPAVEPRLEKQLGSHAEFERFSNQLLDLDEAAMDRVYAVHRLAQKFPFEEEAQLSAGDVNMLHELTRKHIAALAGKVTEMERLLTPALAPLGGAATAAAPTPRTSWQQAAADVYQSARRVEVMESELLGMTSATASAKASPAELLAAVKELRANLAECQKLLAAK